MSIGQVQNGPKSPVNSKGFKVKPRVRVRNMNTMTNKNPNETKGLKKRV
jgi:hypothetical protein